LYIVVKLLVLKISQILNFLWTPGTKKVLPTRQETPIPYATHYLV